MPGSSFSCRVFGARWAHVGMPGRDILEQKVTADGPHCEDSPWSDSGIAAGTQMAAARRSSGMNQETLGTRSFACLLVVCSLLDSH